MQKVSFRAGGVEIQNSPPLSPLVNQLLRALLPPPAPKAALRIRRYHQTHRLMQEPFTLKRPAGGAGEEDSPPVDIIFDDRAARLQFTPGWRLLERQPVIQAGRTQARKINCFSPSGGSLRRLVRTLWSWEMKNTAFGIEVRDEIRTWPCTQRVSGLWVKSSRRWARSDKRTAPSLRQERESGAGTYESLNAGRCGDGDAAAATAVF